MKPSTRSIHALACVFALTSTGALAATERQVAVSGECSRRTPPDRGSIQVTAEFRDADLKVATRKAMDTHERVKAQIKRLQLADPEITTSEYSANEIREWTKDRMVHKGYIARMGLEVSTSDIQRLGEVIAIASREEMKDVGALRMYLSQDKLRSERIACLKDAAQNAKEKAEKLAAALSATVGSVLSIAETSADGLTPAPMPRFYKSADAETAQSLGAPSVEAGKQEINVAIKAVFELK